MPQRELSVIIKLKDEASKQMQTLTRRFESFNDRIESSARTSRSFGFGLAAVGASVGAFGIMALRAAGDMEQTRVSFETMLGSAKNADKFIRDMVDFARKTPFELKGLEQASKQLLAYGSAQEEVLPELRILGDISAGVGTDKLPNLILAFGQVRAATRLTGMELRQFTEAGVPLLGELAKQYGTTAAKVQKMVSTGQVGFDDVKAALAALTGEGGRFNNLMDKQSKTLGGMISNLKDAWDIFLRGEGQKLLEWAKNFVKIAINIVENVLPKWIDVIGKLTSFFVEHKTALIIVAGAILGALVPAVLAAAAAFAVMAISLAPFMIGGAIVAGIVAGVLWLVKNWDLVEQKADELWAKVAAVWQSIADWVGGKTKAVMEIVKKAIKSIAGFWGEQWERVFKAVETVWNAIVEIVKFSFAFILGLFGTNMGEVKQVWETTWNAIKQVFEAVWDAITLTVRIQFEILKTEFMTAKTVLTAIWDVLWNTIRAIFTPIIEGIKTVTSGMWTVLTGLFKSGQKILTTGWEGFWSSIGDIVGGAWEAIKNTVKGGINWVIDKINGFIRAVNRIAAKGAIGGLSIVRIPEIPKLATGGIVTKPTLAMVGEAGPEAVVPLRRSGGFGNVIVHLNVGSIDSSLDAAEVARTVGDEIMKRLKLNMNLVA